MAWAYYPALPRPLDVVRLTIGDTDSTDQQLQDEEITYLLTQQNNNATSAAIVACTMLAAKYSRKVTDRSQDQSVNWSDIAKSYHLLAASLRQTLITGGGLSSMPLIYAGGLSANEHYQDSINTDLMQPVFTKEPFTEPGTGTTVSTNDAAYGGIDTIR